MNIDSEIIHSASTINERKRKKNWIDRCGRSRWVTNSLEIHEGSLKSYHTHILAPPTVRTVLDVRLNFQFLIEHLALIGTAKYLQDISIIDGDMESKT